LLQPTLVTTGRALLSGLIDYAGLFPPASLDMPEAIAEFREARTGPNGWIVHRFLCPAGRLEELAGHVASSMVSGEQFWSVGLIVDGPLGPSIASGQAFEAEMAPGASLSAIEVKLAPIVSAMGDVTGVTAVEAIADAAATLGEATLSYIEVGIDDDPAADIAAIAEVAATGRRVAGKVRCGGVTASAVPSSQALARVLLAAAGHSLAMKATAGLHHPVRRYDGGLGTEMHGFLNLAVAQHLAATGAGQADVVAALEETDATAFRFGTATLTWRDHRIGARAIQEQRAGGLHGFGSCSFEEPIEDLLVIGVSEVVA
jgi:hypothetical protein